MTGRPRERVYDEAEIAERLAQALPLWRHEGGFIRRTYRTHGWKATLMVVNAIGHLAEAAWHHPELAVSYAAVEVALQNHDAKGITDKDFELARKIEEVVQWRPGADSALTGTPNDDPRFAYIRYDPPA
jgi:4a-hydroxytetrahydrobiopterin dehydratase